MMKAQVSFETTIESHDIVYTRHIGHEPARHFRRPKVSLSSMRERERERERAGEKDGERKKEKETVPERESLICEE